MYLDEEGETVPDPFFGVEGPARTGCVRCGRCMMGCRHGAKKTLVKNYLYLAEGHGVRVMPERTVCDIRPLRAHDGSDGYVVSHERSGAWLRRDHRRVTARGVIVAAGALGTSRGNGGQRRDQVVGRRLSRQRVYEFDKSRPDL